MVFTVMTTNAPTIIPSPTITKFPSNRRQRKHRKAHSPCTDNWTHYRTKAHFQIHRHVHSGLHPHLQSPNTPMTKLHQPISHWAWRWQQSYSKPPWTHWRFHRSTKSMLSTPLHSGCLFSPSINWTQPDTHPHLDTYQVCLQSPLREGARGFEKEHQRAYISPYHQSRSPPSLLQADSTPHLEVQPAPYLNVHRPPNFQSPLGSL